MLYKGVVLRNQITSLILLILGIVSSTISFAGSVVLAWDASPDATVVGYKIYYGGASGSYTNSALVGNVTNATFTGLVNGATYYFAATSIDGSGFEGDFSNESVSTIPLNANQAPTLNTIANVAINEDASAQSVNLSGISTGATNETQTLTVTASSSNAGLIPNPSVTYTSPNATGSLAFTPVANASGSATVTVTVNDGGASNNIVTRTFTVTVNAANDAPTITALSSLTITEDAAAQTVNLSGISAGAGESQTLSVSASSSNTGLIPNPSVTYTSPNATGTLAFTPVANASGSAIVTVTINDGGVSNNIVTSTFTVTVNAANDAPTLNTLANITVNEGTAQTVSLAGIGTGATNESQTLTVTASSSNPGLIPNPTVSYTSPSATGSLSFTPATGTSGSATITVTVNDAGAANNTFVRTFTATVNRLPAISLISNQTVLVSTATAAIPFSISDTETAATSLTVTANSSNSSLVLAGGIVLGGSGGNRTVMVTPISGATGNADITITVGDGAGTKIQTFTLSVVPKPTAPANLRIAQALP